MPVRLTRNNYETILAHSVDAFPSEGCGFVVRRNGRQEVVPISNVQDEKHAEDPQRFPRTAATAYTMGPDAIPVLIDHEHKRVVIEAIYHSHPQHDAYFSAEDRQQATVWDEPSYPEAGQIVVSVYEGAVRAVKVFAWEARRRDFVEVELELGAD